MKYVPKLNAEQRATRRKEAAQAVVDGESKESICHRLGVSFQWLRDACRGNGVDVIHSRRTMSVTTYSILADLLNTSDSVEVVAERCSVSRQRVHQVVCQARKAGIKFPHRGRRS